MSKIDTVDSTVETQTIPNSFIKNIAIQLDDSYRLDNTPFVTDDEHYIKKLKIISFIKDFIRWLKEWLGFTVKKENRRRFIGRELLREKFLRFLKDSQKGVYLVTGFRGLGKTSFVNDVLNSFKENKPNLILIHLTIAQNKPKESDLLRLMVSSVYERYTDYLMQKGKHGQRKRKTWKNIIIGILILFGFCMIIPLMVFFKPELVEGFITNQYKLPFFPSINLDMLKQVSYVMVATVFVVVPFLLLLLLYFKYKESTLRENLRNPLARIKFLHERCQATIVEDSGDVGESNIQGGIRLFVGGKKKAMQYPIADSKEMEFELQQFLQLSHKKGVNYLFIFDELDKIETGVDSSSGYDTNESSGNKENEDAYQKQFREKKQAVVGIISGLKNFFSNAYARFIFIAGKEMFDASLADVADRQSALSSMFTYVFNVESLLKEWDTGGNNNASLSNSIEEYLKTLFFSNDLDGENKKSFLQLVKEQYTDKMHGIPSLEESKMLFTLQDFICYLVYRSNGSPKKLIKSVHEFITIEGAFNESKTIVFRKENKPPGIKKRNELNSTGEEKEKKLYLYFNYYSQYRLGFTSYLYRPFLVQYGRSLKLYSDNIILSTPYLFDHLLKFHPYAFSIANLELVPEILSTNKTPYLREYLRHIISYLGHNHIRNTDIDLFDYKFYSRTQNEIKFISKVFEPEAAAFNFTLDEGYAVKLHIRGKIRELRRVYSGFLGEGASGKHQIFSIAHFNGILGDLHFFDQEYDDAIEAYSDAILPINHLNVMEMNMRDFISLIKNKLKLGLCFERIGSYKDALSFYTDSSMDTRRYMVYKLKHAKPVNFQDNSNEPENTEIDPLKPEEDQVGSGTTETDKEDQYSFISSSTNDLLQIVNQTFLAKIIIQEKMGFEGTNLSKLKISLGDFLAIARQVSIKDTLFSYSNHLIISNAYLVVGKLVYFKNSQAILSTSKNSNNDFPVSKTEETSEQDFITKINVLDNKFHLFPPQAPDSRNHCFSRRKPVVALYFYILGICEILSCRNIKVEMLKKITESNDVNNIVFEILDFLSGYIDSGDESLTGLHYRYIATLLSAIGDCLLSMNELQTSSTDSEQEEKHAHKYKAINLSDIFNLFASPISDAEDLSASASNEEVTSYTSYDLRHFLQKKNSKSFSFTDIFHCYYLSGKYYLKYGKSLSMSFQYRKILYTLRLITGTALSTIDGDKILKIIKNTLVLPALQAVSKNASGGDVHMILKAEKLGIPYDTAINHISNHPEYREVLVLYNYIRIKLGIKSPDQHLLVSVQSSFSTQFSRVLELDYYAKYISPIAKNMFGIHENITVNIETALNFLFAMISILRTLSIYGTDYMLGHSYRAYTHYRIASFIQEIPKNAIWEFSKTELQKQLDFLLGQGSYSSLDIEYHYTQAIIYYTKAVELHTAGSEYKVALEKMTYLEDDFNDTAYHFGAAIERYMMINNAFKYRLDECSEKLARLIAKKNTSLLSFRQS